MARKYSLLTCCRCGKKFDFFEAKDLFEERFESASYELEFYTGSDEYCGECACDIFESNYGEEGDTPYGCIACGNPAYPDCLMSCNIYDDD